MVGGNWEYTAAYPSFLADSSAHMNRYRIRVASTPGNLNNASCSFFDLTTIVVWVNNCSVVLPTVFKSFNGQAQNGFANLHWLTENETAGIAYEVERSDDNIHFYTIASIAGNGSGSYSFNDPGALIDQTYYRIKMVDGNSYKYSKILLLSSSHLEYAIKSLINPFVDVLSFELIAPETGIAKLTLIDTYGRIVRQSTKSYVDGLNQMKMYNLTGLSQGAYLLQVQAGKQVFNKNVIKSN